jgi:hypothetical protein
MLSTLRLDGRSGGGGREEDTGTSKFEGLCCSGSDGGYEGGREDGGKNGGAKEVLS